MLSQHASLAAADGLPASRRPIMSSVFPTPPWIPYDNKILIRQEIFRSEVTIKKKRFYLLGGVLLSVVIRY